MRRRPPGTRRCARAPKPSRARAYARSRPGGASSTTSTSSVRACSRLPASRWRSAASTPRAQPGPGVSRRACSSSAAAAAGAPRARARRAASSSAAATSSSGASAASARCRARSSGSSTSAAARAWRARLSATRSYATVARRGWANRTRAAPAGEAAARGDVGVDLEHAGCGCGVDERGRWARQRGREVDRLAAGVRERVRAGPRPARAGPPGRASRPSSSSAKNGLPPDSRCSRAASGRGTGAPRRAASARARSASPSGPTVTTRGCSSPSGMTPTPRRATSSPPRLSRRATNASAVSDSASSHCTSSTATIVGVPLSTPRNPSATARWSCVLARLRPQQRHLERVPLRPGQLGQLLVGDGRQQVAERRVGKLRLGLHRAAGQDAERRAGDGLLPQRRLARSQLALEQQRRRAVGHRRQERVDLLELGCAAVDHRHTYS